MTVHTSVPLDHRCPNCGAHRHQPCTTVGGRTRSAHLQRKARAHAARHEPRRYVLKADSTIFGLAAGDVLVCAPYWLEPEAKATVLYREADRYAPGVTIGWDDVTAVPGRAGIVPDGQDAAAAA